MSRKKPSYRKHPNGQAFVQHKSIEKPGHRLYLGVHGSDESFRRYREFLNSLGVVEERAFPSGGVVGELVDSYLGYAKAHYRGDGKNTSEYTCTKEAVSLLLKLFADLPACEFGPRNLMEYQRAAVSLGKWSRTTINSHAGRVKRMFRWAASHEYLPASVWHALRAVEGLKAGRTEAREAEPIPAVPWDAVEPFLPFFSPTIAAMVTVQWWCGCRPQDVCRLRQCDLDTSGEIWLYVPPKHKNSWRGHSLIKAIPRRVQPLLASFFREDAAAWLFSPQDSLAWHSQQRAANAGRDRKTPVYPSELRSRAQKKKNQIVKERRPYTTRTYYQAIEYGQARCNRKREEEALPSLPLWTPMQLRHGVATFVDRQLGRQAAQRYLGHKNLSTTEIYVERDTAELVEIARRLDELNV
jgi:integrase